MAVAGRRYWQAIQNAMNRPWWVYSCGPRDCRHHEGLSDLVFSFDDPIWRSLYPPNSPDCMCSVRKYTSANVEERSFDETASYDGREVPVVGREYSENRGHRMHRLSADRRKVEPDPGWLGRPVACEPAEVYRGSRYSFQSGGMIVPPDVPLPYQDAGDRSLPVGVRRLAALREKITIGVAQVLSAESVEQAVRRSPGAILWAQAWGVDLEDGAALAAQSRALPADLNGAALAAHVQETTLAWQRRWSGPPTRQQPGADSAPWQPETREPGERSPRRKRWRMPRR
ncbi:MAG: hypothetical protein OXH32_04690 [Acidobacteria bacterium]|nr:hypothetical protein [Acidobacteriota bacterium]MXZ37917.1 hypothetical protein [Holophagales bacterium]